MGDITIKKAPTAEEIQSAEEARITAELTRHIQEHLDATAQQRRYDGILSLCTYATSVNAKFAAEGQAGVEWRDAVWAKGYELLAQAQAGQISVPTKDDLIAMLPAFQWPDVASA
ncbi:hypothetical protein DFO67_108140 [Modicisalibacter xianhensis]|uniref:Uncharacterized protein n=1 Tax=Modicisalibacter xianhensis TaxID=442341 RepID=A0A4R8G1W5_9GAMM|nr:hypothetical protein [Halomonas xianhensis]TDX29096.1 hypothetical protein DFO67_108140 [Halomonas xianhensis]